MSTKTWIFLALAAGILAGLFALLRPAPADVSEAPVAVAEPPIPVAAPAPRVFELRIEQGRLAPGSEVIRVNQGEEVTLQISADRDDEFHLHGYDLHAELRAGATQSLSFTAERSGRFDFELHHAHKELGALEVVPR